MHVQTLACSLGMCSLKGCTDVFLILHHCSHACDTPTQASPASQTALKLEQVLQWYDELHAF